MTDHPVTAPEPWPSWLADLTPEDRVRKVVRAVAACYGGDSHDQPATQHCSIGVAEMFLSRLLDEARQQAHYLSTSCFHGEHLYCQSGTGAAECGETWAKVPAKCKFCPATCRCGCHSGEAAAAAEPVSFAAAMELRAQIAEALDGFLSTEQATIAADSVMVVVVPALRMQPAPVPSAEYSQAVAALRRLALDEPMTDLKPGNHAWLALEAEMTARREYAAGALDAIGSEPLAREPQGGNTAAEVPPEPAIDALTRIREWAAAEPSGLMLRRDVVGTLDRVLSMSPERAAELADYRGRIAKAVALLHQSSEYAISDALAGLLTRILSDPPRTGSGPARGEGRRGRI